MPRTRLIAIVILVAVGVTAGMWYLVPFRSRGYWQDRAKAQLPYMESMLAELRDGKRGYGALASKPPMLVPPIYLPDYVDGDVVLGREGQLLRGKVWHVFHLKAPGVALVELRSREPSLVIVDYVSDSWVLACDEN